VRYLSVALPSDQVSLRQAQGRLQFWPTWFQIEIARRPPFGEVVEQQVSLGFYWLPTTGCPRLRITRSH
jgi:hypothetical protein